MPLPDNRYIRAVWFALTGLVNTLVGVAMITAAGLAGCGPMLSNIIGYVLGLACSFAINSRLTFRNAEQGRYTALRFYASFLIALSINLLAVKGINEVVELPPLVGNLVGVPVYTAVFFLLCEYWVFGKRRSLV